MAHFIATRRKKFPALTAERRVSMLIGRKEVNDMRLKYGKIRQPGAVPSSRREQDYQKVQAFLE